LSILLAVDEQFLQRD